MLSSWVTVVNDMIWRNLWNDFLFMALNILCFGFLWIFISSAQSVKKEHPLGLASSAHLSPGGRIEDNYMRRKMHGVVIDVNNLQMLDEKRDIFYFLSFILQNTKPVGHQVSCNDNFSWLFGKVAGCCACIILDWLFPFSFMWCLQDLVGLVISMLLLGDFSLALLTLLQLYSISLADVFLVLFILPFGILLPFPVGINALFSHGPRRSAGLARLYALWNITSFINVVSFLSIFSWLVIFCTVLLSGTFTSCEGGIVIWSVYLFVLFEDLMLLSLSLGGCITLWIYSLQLSIVFQ